MADSHQVPVTSLSRNELRARWQAIHRTPPPRGIHRGLLEHAISWHEQAKRHGGLPAWVERQLGSGRRPKHQGQAPKRKTADRGTSLQRGTRLVREWGGRTHVVDVTADGFVWNGRHYRSLTAIAKAITGARWSGPRFFGLNAHGR